MRIRYLFLLLLLAVSAASYCEDDKPADLGASFNTVWFRGERADKSFRKTSIQAEIRNAKAPKDETATSASPLVGIDIDPKKLQEAIIMNVTSQRSPADLLKTIQKMATAPKMAKGRDADLRAMEELWQVVRDGADEPCELLGIQYDKDKFTLILAPNYSYNGTYQVRFNLSKFLDSNAGEGAWLVQKDISLTGRLNLTLNTDFAKKGADLITVETEGEDEDKHFVIEDGKYKHKSADATQVDFGASYDGFSNPLQKSLFHERSYYKLSIGGTLSENRFDQKSKIELDLDGVTDIFNFGNHLVTTTGFRYLTSQSQRQQTLLYEIGVRKGDKRGESSEFVASDDVLQPVYFEAALQVGKTRFRHIDDVPDARQSEPWIVRPRVAIGFNDFLKFKGSWIKISGKLDYYYLAKDLGGADDPDGLNDGIRGWREFFTFTATIGPKDQSITFSIKGGTNPAQGFIKVAPTYGVGMNFKF